MNLLAPELIYEIVKNLEDVDKMMFSLTSSKNKNICELVVDTYNNNDTMRKGMCRICKRGNVCDIELFVEIYDIFEEMIAEKEKGTIASLFFGCKYGNLEIVKWIIDRLQLDGDCVIKYGTRIISVLAIRGQLETFDWLVEHFQFSQYDERFNRFLGNAIKYACGNGHMKMAKYLLKKYPDYYEKKGRHDKFPNWVFKTFHEACEEDQTETIKWLSKEYIHGWTNYSFYCACVNGNLELAKWFQNKYQITKGAIKKSDYNWRSILKHTCQNGFLEVLKWFTETMNITHKDIFQYKYAKYLVNNILKSELSIVKYFIIHFNIQKEDLTNLYYEINWNIEKPKNSSYQWIKEYLKF